jgi:hypothetical protein
MKDETSGLHGCREFGEILPRPHLQVDIDEVRPAEFTHSLGSA